MVKLSSSFVKTYSTKNILVPHINNWFAANQFPDVLPIEINMNKEVDDAFHPSSSTKCAQLIYAERRGDVPHVGNTLESNKNFMFGHFTHGVIYYILQDLGFVDEDDIEWEFDTAKIEGAPFRVRGFVDVRECRVPGHEPILVDVKTQQAKLYASDPRDELLEKYTAQVNLYLYFSGMPQGVILWAEKDSPHRFKETIIELDEDLVESIFDKWEMVTEAEQEGFIPACTCGQPSCIGHKLYA